MSKNVQKPDRDKLSETAEDELLGPHKGNFARYQIKPTEFEAWQKGWNA